LAWGERNNRIEISMSAPQIGQLLRCQQRNVRGRESLPQSLQGRHRHHGISEPIDATDQNAAWIAIGQR